MVTKNRGFTLLELLIVTVILGVAAGLAIPAYNLTVEQSRGNEAKINLNIIYMAEKVYKLNTGTYWDGTTTASPASINTALNTNITTNFYTENGSSSVGTSFSGVTATTFTAKMERAGASNKTFIIDQTGTMTESGSY